MIESLWLLSTMPKMCGKFRVLWFIWKFQVVKCFNPLSPRIHTQILLTDWSLELVKRICLLIKVFSLTLSHSHNLFSWYVLILFWENWWWWEFKGLIAMIVLPLCLTSLTHKNPKRCKIIHGTHPTGRKDWSIDPCVFVEISCSCNFCGSWILWLLFNVA